MQKFQLSFCLACLLWLGVATVGKGQMVIKVGATGTVGDVGALVSALTAANVANGNYIIHLTPGATYSISSSLPQITQTCTIVIDGHGATLTRASGTTKLLHIQGQTSPITTPSVLIRNLQISNGAVTGGGGGIYIGGANVTLQGCEINNCSSSPDGAIFAQGNSAHFLTVTDCYIHNNVGSGIEINGAMGFNISNTTFAENTVSGVYAAGGSGGSCNVSNCTFFNNNNNGIYFGMTGETINVSHSTFYGGIYSFQLNAGSTGVADIQNAYL
ncbi:MAG: hypothetical protein EAZ95_18685, partial [Bacteroidetes bacterium]